MINCHVLDIIYMKTTKNSFEIADMINKFKLYLKKCKFKTKQYYFCRQLYNN